MSRGPAHNPKTTRWLLVVAVALIATSALVYVLHYVIFRDAHHIFIYMVHDIAFVPFEVLLTVIIIERLLSRRESAALDQKLNMVVGAFFSELGNSLLKLFIPVVTGNQELRRRLDVSKNWQAKDYAEAVAFTRGLSCHIDMDALNLEELKDRLVKARPFLLGLLENPALLEKDSFTDMLWAVFHLTEELEFRDDLANLPKSDRVHLGLDVKRAFENLAREWVLYTRHLQNNYPYLFSLVVRTHPFQDRPSPLVADQAGG
jgi:hypothetical protein